MTDFGSWSIEARQSSSRLRILVVTILSVLLAFVAGGMLIFVSGENPVDVYRAMWNGALGDRYGLSETLVKATPLILTGLGVSVAFRMQLWNIGAEGQLYLGAIFATGLALFVIPGWPAWAMIPALMAAGLVGGGLWAMIPGALRAYMGVNETITSLMLNYVAILLADYLVIGPWKNPEGFGFPGTSTLPAAAWLPTYGNYRVHMGLLFGLLVAVLLEMGLRRTRWGYKIAVIGENPRAARYAGMNTKRAILLVMIVSGALSGLAGMSEVTGVGHQLQRNFSPGYGYTAIIVAWLARLDPFGIVFVSFLVAALLVGGDQLQMAMGLPSAIAPMLQGIVLFFLLGGQFFIRYQVTFKRSQPQSTMTAEA